MTNLTTTQRDALRGDLYEAQEHLQEAIGLLERYVDLTGDRHAETYLVDHLKIYAGRDHGFLSSDPNIDELLDRLDEAGEDEDDDPDTDAPEMVAPDGRTLYYSRSLGRYVTIPQDDEEGEGE